MVIQWIALSAHGCEVLGSNPAAPSFFPLEPAPFKNCSVSVLSEKMKEKILTLPYLGRNRAYYIKTVSSKGSYMRPKAI